MSDGLLDSSFWPIITADQWIALGTMLGGVAQFGLVVVGALAGREWVRQERYKGVRDIFETHQTETNRILNMLKQLYIPRDDLGAYMMAGHHTSVLHEFDSILRELHLCAIKMYLYDESLGDAIQQANMTLESYRSKYLMYLDEVKKSFNFVSSTTTRATDCDEILVMERELFTTESRLWESFVYKQIALQNVAKKLFWGRSRS